MTHYPTESSELTEADRAALMLRAFEAREKHMREMERIARRMIRLADLMHPDRSPERSAEHYVSLAAHHLGRPDALIPPQSKPRKETPRKDVPSGVKRAVWDRDEWTCKHCGDHRNLTVDHIIPLAHGGTDHMDNYQTLCGSCNSRKGAR